MLVFNFCFLNVLLHHVSVANQVQDACLLVLCLLPEVLDLPGEGVDSCLGDSLLVLSLLLELANTSFIGDKLVVRPGEHLVLLLKLPELVFHIHDVLLSVVQFVFQVVVLAAYRVVEVFEGVVLLGLVFEF